MGIFCSKDDATARQITDLQDRINFLEKQNQRLMKNQQGGGRTEEGGGNVTLTGMSPVELQALTRIRLRGIVTEMLKDPEINIKWLSNDVEEKIYMNIGTMLFRMFEKGLESVNVSLGDMFRIRFVVDPVEPKPKAEKEEEKESEDQEVRLLQEV